MRKHCSDVCKLRPCLNKESKNSARLCTIVTAVLQRQYSQTELIFWISLVLAQRHSTTSDKTLSTKLLCFHLTHIPFQNMSVLLIPKAWPLYCTESLHLLAYHVKGTKTGQGP